MILVRRPGTFTTVQDLGRPGFQAHGIPAGGAADAYSFRIANLLVGNPESAAALECTLRGPVLTFQLESPALAALTGAPIAGVPMWRPFLLHPGEELDLSHLTTGCRSYLAIRGGIDVPLILNSRSTYAPAHLGGHEGRPLRAGDRLAFFNRVQGSGSRVQDHFETLHPEPWTLNPSTIRRRIAPSAILPMPTPNTPTPLRLLPGPQWHWFSPAAQQHFLTAPFTISPHADRMGLRLTESLLEFKSKFEPPNPEPSTLNPYFPSEAVTTGTIQIPSGGHPILLLADHQTLGGYPKIATIIRADWPLLAQLRPGDTVTFQQTTLATAERLLQEQSRTFAMLRLALSPAH